MADFSSKNHGNLEDAEDEAEVSAADLSLMLKSHQGLNGTRIALLADLRTGRSQSLRKYLAKISHQNSVFALSAKEIQFLSMLW